MGSQNEHSGQARSGVEREMQSYIQIMTAATPAAQDEGHAQVSAPDPEADRATFDSTSEADPNDDLTFGHACLEATDRLCRGADVMLSELRHMCQEIRGALGAQAQAGRRPTSADGLEALNARLAQRSQERLDANLQRFPGFDARAFAGEVERAWAELGLGGPEEWVKGEDEAVARARRQMERFRRLEDAYGFLDRVGEESRRERREALGRPGAERRARRDAAAAARRGLGLQRRIQRRGGMPRNANDRARRMR